MIYVLLLTTLFCIPSHSLHTAPSGNFHGNATLENATYTTLTTNGNSQLKNIKADSLTTNGKNKCTAITADSITTHGHSDFTTVTTTTLTTHGKTTVTDINAKMSIHMDNLRLLMEQFLN